MSTCPRKPKQRVDAAEAALGSRSSAWMQPKQRKTCKLKPQLRWCAHSPEQRNSALEAAEHTASQWTSSDSTENVSANCILARRRVQNCCASSPPPCSAQTQMRGRDCGKRNLRESTEV